VAEVASRLDVDADICAEGIDHEQRLGGASQQPVSQQVVLDTQVNLECCVSPSTRFLASLHWGEFAQLMLTAAW
jgi:hypothetical protein